MAAADPPAGRFCGLSAPRRSLASVPPMHSSFAACRGFALVLTLVAPLAAAAETARSLRSFGGVEEPHAVYHVAEKSFATDDFVSITDRGGGRFRMELRYRGTWWDGDRDTRSTDRQRAEVKVLGPRQRPGETFEYWSTWRLDPAFKVGRRFCHITQVKGYGGPDTGAPLVTTSILSDTDGAVRYCSSEMRGLAAVREFKWRPDTPKTVAYRLTTSSANGTADGGLAVSIDGDAFAGVSKVKMYRRDAPEYQPKWGLYRGVTTDMPFGDDWVEHADIHAVKLPAR